MVTHIHLEIGITNLCARNKNLFARKFSEKEDKSVILKIMTDLKKGV